MTKKTGAAVSQNGIAQKRSGDLLFFGIPSFEKEPSRDGKLDYSGLSRLSAVLCAHSQVVASECPLPLYAIGNEFRET